MNIIGFHNPDEENGYLSNWYLSDFEIDGITFSSIEQYMMWEKARHFKDENIQNQIMQTDNPSEIKSLGRKVSNFNHNYWNGIRQIVVYNGLYAKFSQNDDLARKLKNTGDAVLVECAVNDKIWGIGLSMHDDISNPSDWKGENLLGYSLMMVREKLE